MLRIEAERLRRQLSATKAGAKLGVAPNVVRDVELLRRTPWPALREGMATLYEAPEEELFADMFDLWDRIDGMLEANRPKLPPEPKRPVAVMAG